MAAEAILLLRRRGFTKAEICKLAGVSFSTLLDWERKTRRVTPNGTGRLGLVLAATAHLPAGPEPCYRRRLPHPELAALLALLAPRLAAYPMRSRWRSPATCKEAA